MRLGTQASRKWSFRGAYQAFHPSLSLSFFLALSSVSLVACNIRACLAASESPFNLRSILVPLRPLDRRRSVGRLSRHQGLIPRGLSSNIRCLAHVPHTFLIDSTRFSFRRSEAALTVISTEFTAFPPKRDRFILSLRLLFGRRIK